MSILVTGSAGHLGEALMRRLRAEGRRVRGCDVSASPFTDIVGSIADPQALPQAIAGTETVFHCATLHKPHVATHSRHDFLEVNVRGTLALLESAVKAGVRRFVFTSTTSVFGDALQPPAGAPAAWIDEDTVPIVKNIYGATKAAAEDLCRLFHRDHGLAVVVLRTARFFPEADDDPAIRDVFEDINVKLNEYLFRRVDIADVVEAHLCAARCAERIGFGRYVISATTPFRDADLAFLHSDAPAVFARRLPDAAADYERLGYRMFAQIDRVYDNARARRDLGWQPAHDFRSVLARVERDGDWRSALARAVGAKGYHGEAAGAPRYPFL